MNNQSDFLHFGKHSQKYLWNISAATSVWWPCSLNTGHFHLQNILEGAEEGLATWKSVKVLKLGGKDEKSREICNWNTTFH